MNKDMELKHYQDAKINVLKQRLYIFVCRLFLKAFNK